MKTKLIAVMMLVAGSAFAAPHISIGVGIGTPGYYAPAPVPYVAARPPMPGPGYVWIDHNTLFSSLTECSGAGDLEFDGTFSEATHDGDACANVFQVEAYHARHALAGPTLRTSVLRLSNPAQGGGGFFDGLVFVGLLGGSNDLDYDKTLATDGDVSFKIHAEGFIDQNVLYLEFAVTGVTADGAMACTAHATFSGFD
mgnify:CR=1 FL=1